MKRLPNVRRAALPGIVLATALLVAFAATASWGASPLSPPPAFPDQSRSSVVPGRYIVTLEDSVGHPRRVARRQTKQRGGKLGFVYRHAIKGYSAELSKGAVEALRRNPSVLRVEPDRRLELFAQSTPAGIDRINASANENLAIDGADNFRVDADVAVIDSGIDHEHPDLNVVLRVSCTQLVESFPGVCVANAGTDKTGHGTHVGGIVGALDNGEGVVGVAPGARLWSLRVTSTFTGFASFVTAAVDWVTSHADEIEVVNMSLGCPGCEIVSLDEAISASVDAGVVYVVAAGNEVKEGGVDTKGWHLGKPSDVIVVSAIADYDGKPLGEAEPLERLYCDEVSEEHFGEDDTRATFSNFGEEVDLAAPGVCIPSTFPVSNSFLWEPVATSEGYGPLSGTSMASPHVAGAAALLAAEENPEDREDVEAIRDTLVEEGNTDGIEAGGWEDTSEDGEKEPLLDVGSEAAFAPTDAVLDTGEAEVLSESEATLHGAVNPGGVETEYYFEYGPTDEYGLRAPSEDESAGSGSEYVSVEETLKELEGGTPYHYRLVASNEKGTFDGLDRTFGWPLPKATTHLATDVESGRATLHAAINPEGSEATYRFELTDHADFVENGYEKATLVPNLLTARSAGSGSSNVAGSEIATGLEPNTKYHFRVRATNGGGTTYGEDQQLTTTEALTLEPSEGFPASFSLAGEAKVTLQGPTPIACTTEGETQALGGEGQFEDATSGTVTLTLRNCTETGFESSCTTAGQEAGTILAEDLPFELTYLSDGEPGIVLLPNPESHQIATASCFGGFTAIVIKGNGLLGRITVPGLGEPSSTLAIDFSAPEVEGEYVQEYTEDNAAARYVLREEVNGAEPQLAALEAAPTATFSEGEGTLVDTELALEPPEGFPASFSLAGKAKVTLQAQNPIVCTTEGETQALGGEGQFEDATSGTATLLLRNCTEIAFGSKCKTPGEEAGTINAEGLPFSLTSLSDGEPGIAFLPDPESEKLATGSCFGGFIPFEIAGSGALGHITAPWLGEPSSTLAIDLNAPESEGEHVQEYTETLAGAEYGLLAKVGAGAKLEPATLEAEPTASFGAGEGELVQ